MKHDATGLSTGGTKPSARYENSRLEVRGPLRVPAGRYVACVGGTETFGAELVEPFPALLERQTGLTCLNLGTRHAGPGALLDDTALLSICNGAVQVVLETTGAAGLSNRFYTVHPRRNDRFLSASETLRALYPEVDFTEFCFVRHLLGALRDLGETRFTTVRAELRTAWSMRMRVLIDRIAAPVILLTMPSRVGCGSLGEDPLFVDRPMIEALRPLVAGIVSLPSDDRAPAARHAAAAAGLAPCLATPTG